MLWAIIVGGLIGLIAGGITKKGDSMGIIANIFAGLVGSSVGQSLFGAWGPRITSYNVCYTSYYEVESLKREIPWE
ncbi:GlsB/YeaQ/YmgE family stress response membrane protein [Streptococcus alactolyticus]|uniref:GlsB/YeaQ/YmgE family stress response membrane protein n=1 Tax=Streptococcus alactolyticus TaxID=29389 RepID=UPI003AF6A7C5